MSIKTGAAAWGFRELSLEEQLRLCREMEIQILELGIANAPGDLPEDASDEQIQETVELYQKYGIKMNCAATGNDFTRGTKEEIKAQTEKIKHVITICRKAGIGCLRIFAGFSPAAEVTGERWENMITALNEASDHAEKCGVTLAVETHGGVNAFTDGVEHFASVSTEAELLGKMLNEIRESICFVFDPANLAAAGHEDVNELYELLKDRIAYMHAKNFIRLPSGHLDQAAVENGIFNWEAFMKQCSSYSGEMLVEYEKPETIREGTLESIRSLEKWGTKQ